MKLPEDYGILIRENERMRNAREEQLERCIGDAVHKYYGLYLALSQIQNTVNTAPPLLRWLFARRVKEMQTLAADALKRPKPRTNYSLGEHLMEAHAEPAPLER